MLELDPLLLEGSSLKLHSPLKKNKCTLLAIYWKLPTWPKRNDPPISHYLRRARGPLRRIFPPSDLRGTSPPTSYLLPVCKCPGAAAPVLGSPSSGSLLHNKPSAGVELSFPVSILCLFHSNNTVHMFGMVVILRGHQANIGAMVWIKSVPIYWGLTPTGGSVLGDSGYFGRWDLAGGNRSVRAGPWEYLFLGPFWALSLSASYGSWNDQLSYTIYSHHHDGLPKPIRSSNYGMNPLKPWAKVNPSSLKLFMSGILSLQWQK
jgi:hypothetical protein